MSWLAGWNKRVKITLDHNDINEALPDFPVLIYLSTSSGINGDDVSCVFDELGSDTNRKKIAVTEDDGVTQCYVEIEKWDHASEKAWLWVKVPGISADVDTVLYLYYDSTHADNDDYVGDTNSTPAENVWASDAKMVQHLRDATTSTTLDSTSNNNDGVKKAANEPIETAGGKIDSAQSFDGDDRITTPLSIIDLSVTITFWQKTNQLASEGTFFGPNSRAINKGYVMVNRRGINTDDLRVFYATATVANSFAPWVNFFAGYNNAWTQITVIYDYVANTISAYRNGVFVSTLNMLGAVPPHADGLYHIGSSLVTPLYIIGDIDELRIYNSAKSAEWIKADYESGRDHLNVFETGEYTLTVNVVGGGSVSLNPSYPTYNYGESVELTAIADPGWAFDSWGGDLGGAVNPETIIINENKIVTAIFTKITWTIKASAGAGGTINPTGDIVVDDGDNQSFIITPDAGYHISDALVDGVSVGAVASYIFTGVTANHTIEASFEAELVKPTVIPPARRRRRRVEPEPFERTWTPKTIIYQEYYTEAPLEAQIHEIVREWRALFTHKLYSVHQAAAAATQIIFQPQALEASIRVLQGVVLHETLQEMQAELQTQIDSKSTSLQEMQALNKKVTRALRLIRLKERLQHE